MTGFGRGEASGDGITATVEIKSLNSRYLDLSIRLPQQLQHKELEVKELIQKTVSRGKLNVTVHLTETNTEGVNIAIDEDKVKAYSNILNKIRELSGIQEPLGINDLLQFTDIFVEKEESEQSIKKNWNLVETALQEALLALINMRSREGNQLKKDLLDRISLIEDSLITISESSAGRSQEIRNKLMERVQGLLDDERIDKERLELEVIILADKMDITEEVVRLRSHLKFFIEAVEQPEPAGRRLNFLTQEINRELNTIGSKASDSEIARYVVKGKEALEQIREQVQNVE